MATLTFVLKPGLRKETGPFLGARDLKHRLVVVAAIPVLVVVRVALVRVIIPVALRVVVHVCLLSTFMVGAADSFRR